MAKNILIVDEDELVRQFLAVRLSTSGYRPFEAEDGIEALELLEQQRIDLIVMDQMLPRLSGQETLIRIRGNPDLSQIPVIFLSQRKRSEDVQTALAIGAARYVTKPFSCDQLIDTIQEVLVEARNKRIKRLKVTIFGSALAAGSFGGGAGATVLEAQDVAPPPAQEQTIEEPSRSTPVEETVDEGPSEVRNEIYFGATHTQSFLDQDLEDWTDTRLEVTWRPDSDQSYSVSIAHAEQFSLQDDTIAVKGNWRLSEHSEGYLALRMTPDADFRDSFGVHAGYGHVVARNVGVGIDLRYGDYQGGAIVSAGPRIMLSAFGDRYGLTVAYINLWELDSGEHYTGWSARLRGAPSDRLTFQSGMARYPEVETGVAREVQVYFGSVNYRMSDGIRLSVGYARDEYENLYTRRALSIGISVRLHRGS